MDESPIPLGDPEAYATLARAGLTLTEIGRLVGRSPEHARQVLARGGYRTRDLRPPRPVPPPPPPRPTAACSVCGKPVRYRPVGRNYHGGPRFCDAPDCVRAATRWRYANRPAARAAMLLATRQYHWRRRHGTDLPVEWTGPRGQQYCAACGAPCVQFLPGRPVRFCNRPECRRAAAWVRDGHPLEARPAPQTCAHCGGPVRQRRPGLTVRFCTRPECAAIGRRTWRARTAAARAAGP